MLADVRGIDLARNVEGLGFLSRSDSRQEEQLGRSDGSTAEDNFLGRQRRAAFPAGDAVCDACGDFVARRTIEEDASRACAPVMIVRLGRSSVSPSRKAWYVLDRLPFFVVV